MFTLCHDNGLFRPLRLKCFKISYPPTHYLGGYVYKRLYRDYMQHMLSMTASPLPCAKHNLRVLPLGSGVVGFTF